MWPFRRQRLPDLTQRSAILDRHFALQEEIETAYRRRDRDPAALPAAIAACEHQIAMAKPAAKDWRHRYPSKTGTTKLPRHVGYEQLAIIREKEGDYTAAIRLARQAQKQGWAGDWAKRIARCEAKRAKR